MTFHPVPEASNEETLADEEESSLLPVDEVVIQDSSDQPFPSAKRSEDDMR